jgi:hypothetical protein
MYLLAARLGARVNISRLVAPYLISDDTWLVHK